MSVGGCATWSRRRRPTSFLGWCGRILIGISVLAVLVVGAIIGVFYLVLYLPQQRDAAAFARLSGPARRLAIYDSFTTQIDRHYFDQGFAGFDWPKLRQEWRSKVTAEPDDMAVYRDVFFQLAQRFPTSHVGAIPPSALASPTNGPTTIRPVSVLCSERDSGMTVVPIRRVKGVGFTIGDVWPNSPAARAGVTPGWYVETTTVTSKAGGGAHLKAVLIQLTPKQMHALENTGAVEVLLSDASVKTPSNTNAALERLRQRVELNYPCGLAVAPFETRRLPNGSLYVRFDEFQAPTMKKVQAALQAAGDHGAVLDLRFNTGGYAALGLNLFLPVRRPLYFERRATGRRLVSTDAATWRYQGPLAVLVGPASASAAEIMAAALKREHRAIIIGRRTNGSVLGSQTYPLPDGGQVQVPVVDVVMLDGRRLEGNGVAPDVEIFPTQAEVLAGQDPALERAERVLSLSTDGTSRR